MCCGGKTWHNFELLIFISHRKHRMKESMWVTVEKNWKQQLEYGLFTNPKYIPF